MDGMPLFDDEAQLPAAHSNIVPRATVRDMVRRRQAALDAFGQAFTSLQAASDTQRAAFTALQAISTKSAETSSYLHLTEKEDRNFVAQLALPKRDDFLAVARKVVDRKMWAHLIELTELERLMDKQAKDQLRQDLMNNPPEATEENVFATLQTFVADADTIFKRGLANCFSKLDRRFKSHNGWKIGGRIVLTYCFDSNGSFHYGRNVADTIHDVDRVFHVLDGGTSPSTYGGIVERIRESRRGGWDPRQSYCESEYFRVRGFKNGNAHVWFVRDDLVAKANKLLGEYYGDVIPEEREAQADPFQPKTTLAKNYGFFPTPDPAADTVVGYAALYRHDKAAGPLMMLEPSAGTGQLAKRARSKGAIVHCIEVHPERADQLRAMNFHTTTADFLTVAPKPVYDRVVMNPPFDRERDIDHVMHALGFLKPDGCLTAIMSAGTEFRENKKATAFRELMEKMGAVWEDLPAGSFASAGTNVNTLVVRVWKDGRKQWGMR